MPVDFEIHLGELVQLHNSRKFGSSPLARYKKVDDIRVGDVVVCSDSQLKNNLDLGTVRHVCEEAQQLPPKHGDGETGELFVSPWNKTRPTAPDPGLFLFGFFVIAFFVIACFVHVRFLCVHLICAFYVRFLCVRFLCVHFICAFIVHVRFFFLFGFFVIAFFVIALCMCAFYVCIFC